VTVGFSSLLKRVLHLFVILPDLEHIPVRVLNYFAFPLDEQRALVFFEVLNHFLCIHLRVHTVTLTLIINNVGAAPSNALHLTLYSNDRRQL